MTQDSESTCEQSCSMLIDLGQDDPIDCKYLDCIAYDTCRKNEWYFCRKYAVEYAKVERGGGYYWTEGITRQVGKHSSRV